jgi:hypothetical protein
VRTISGTIKMHLELEERIARFKRVEACVVFQSGFAANAGTVSAILGPDDHIISDALNHASIIDGCRLSKAKIPSSATRHGARRGATGAGDEPCPSMDGDMGRCLRCASWRKSMAPS